MDSSRIWVVRGHGRMFQALTPADHYQSGNGLKARGMEGERRERATSGGNHFSA